MKIKFVFALVAFIMLTGGALAQFSQERATNRTFSALDRQISVFSKNAGKFFYPLSRLTNSAHSSFLNCGEASFAFSPLAAPCNGVSVTSISFTNTNRTLASGTNNTVGVVYRYSNAGIAPDGTVLDALVTVVDYSNNHDSNQTSFRDADTTSVGFNDNLQPSLEQESNLFISNNSWSGSITYKIQFVATGTTTPKTISVAATTIDNDGSGACGGLRESVTYSSALNQTLTSNSTNQAKSGNTFTGPQMVQNGIGTGMDFANAALFINVSELTWTYSFASTGGCTNGNGSEDRFGSLNMSCQINFGKTFAVTSVSGNVFNDANGLTDNTVNGSGTNAGGLFANLIDASGNVVSSVAVAANGTYSFPSVVDGSFNVQISTNQGVESSPAPAAVLPGGWVNTGEHIGTSAGSDGTINGLLAVTVGGAAVGNVNFGIEQRPVANNNTAASQTNPGGTNNAALPATIFTATDTAPGTISAIRLTYFPSNVASITVNGTQYTSSNFPAGGILVPANGSGNPTQTVSVDPIDGNVTIAVPFAAVDNAGVASSSTASASVPFVTVAISGTVFNDTNGLTDSTVNGIGNNAGGLFANLLNSSNNVVARVAVAANGTYSFSGLNVGNYTIQISTNQGAIANTAPPTDLPNGWVSTGENVGASAGNDGAVNALLSASVGTSGSGLTNVNFGIEHRPVANNHTAASQPNPGSNNTVALPPTTFAAADTAPGTISSIRIIAFPSNITSITINGAQYTNSNFPSVGVVVPTNASGNPTQPILIDPIDGAVTAGILFAAVDNAGVESAAAATANIPFAAVTTAATTQISGRLVSNGELVKYALVVLIESESNSRAFTRTDANGEYRFTEKQVGKSYVVQPVSSKYSFNPGVAVINLQAEADNLNFNASAKKYRPRNDFDGDGKSDVAVWRPADGNWYVLKSSDEQMSVFHFGLSTDKPVSADFDGDGKTDYAVFRPSEGNWYIWQSETQKLRVERFGLAEDRPVPSDFDGDGRADVAVYREGYWYFLRSSDNSFEARHFGLPTDFPIAQDFDGDGKTDLAVYRASEKIWYIRRSSNDNFSAERFGLETDVPVAGDFDGDGIADIAQFRNGFWHIAGSTTGFESGQFGTTDDKAIVGDYDGDGRADTSVYRNGVWFIRNSGSGEMRAVYFGLPTDVPVK